MSQRNAHYIIVQVLFIACITTSVLFAESLSDVVDLTTYEGYPQMVQTVYEAWTKEGKSIPTIVQTTYTNIKKGNTKVTLEELHTLNSALGPYAGSYKAPRKA